MASDQERNEAIEYLFPDVKTEIGSEQLVMVTRTPPHMIMNLVRLEMIEAAMEHILAREKVVESAQGDTEKLAALTVDSEKFLPDELDANEISAEDYLEAVSGELELNLVKVFRVAYDRRMIARNGEGRAEAIDIYSQEASPEKIEALRFS